jgi:alkylation response protein AidB-like acyl-CoA dehydrogenase
MDLTLNSDQTAVLAGLDQLAADFESQPRDFHDFTLASRELQEALQEGQFFDIALIPELGPLCAALAVDRLARLPYAVEVALSMLVRPRLRSNLPRPLALVENGNPGRFVAEARSVLILDGDSMGLARPTPATRESVESLYAYPMGRLTNPPSIEPLSAADAASTRKWLRIALAAEISGLLHAAIAATIEHLNERKQFGRPLATFQALRHRISECAVLAGGVRWLALKASWTGEDGDAAVAAFHAQQSATQAVYDLHQMLGGLGITLEHPLHLWTYRLKALLSELGGRPGQARAVAQHCFT